MSRKRGYLIILIAVVILPVFAYSYNTTFKNRVDVVIKSTKKDSRYIIYKGHLAMFKDNPVKGVGWTINKDSLPKYERKQKLTHDGHNNIINMLSSTGLIGTTIFLTMWIMIFISIFKSISKTNNEDWYTKATLLGLLGGFVSFFISGLTVWNFGDLEPMHNFMFFMALVAHIELRLKKEKKNEIL